MNDSVNYYNPYHRESAYKRWWNSRNWVQQRLIRFSASLLIMIVCFPLYYMGFFGGVEGALSPGHIGDVLAGMGVSRIHAMAVFLSLLIIAVSWNWIFNGVSLVAGTRLTCTRPNAGGRSCSARVRRTRRKNPKTGKMVVQYVCENGHKRPDAQFNPVRKGVVSHSLWLIMLVFCGIVYCSAHIGW